ncbi:inositol monophosphatase family protein (plasmid) [Aminobacter sp. P9b]|uniref:inositol monophosphatase family protein n=1 Tax=Aminobacter sp. P9b TaxID=3133697 RepID=UPI00313845AB
MNLEQRLSLANTLVAEAGRLALAAYAAPSIEVSSKSPGDLVSETDFAIERMIRTEVGNAFPHDNIIGEELGGGASSAGYTWLIDPIDGTVNFARRLGYFCISLALLSDGRPVAAWILDPVQNELFHAGPDGVVRVNEAEVSCSQETDLLEAVIGLGFSSRHGSEVAANVIAGLTAVGTEHRRLGAGALCLAHVAAGRLEGYLEPHMNPWDAVGGLYLATCAGAVTGHYLEADGLAAGAPVYAVAPLLSEQLLAALPAPFSGTPLHRENEPRSTGKVAN